MFVVVVVACDMLHVLDEAQCRARGGKGRITQYRTGHSNDRDWTKLGDWTIILLMEIDGRIPAPVEVGILSHYFFFYIPGGAGFRNHQQY